MMIQIAAILALAVAPSFAAELPTEHTVVSKDTMWDLAGRYYHDPYKWRKIAEANPPPNVKDPHWIYPSQVLRIPALEETSAAEQPAAQAPVAETDQPATATPAPAPVAASVSAPPKPAEKPKHVVRTETQGAAGGEGIAEDFVSDKDTSYRDDNTMVGSFPFAERFKAKAGWKPDGVVLEDPQDGEHIVAEGDTIEVRAGPGGSVRVGQEYAVLRRALPTDTENQKDLYLARIGRVKILAEKGAGVYQATITEANDSPVEGDWIQRAD